MRFLTANEVFNGIQYLPQGTVLVLNDQNCLADILNEGAIEKNRVQHFEGTLCPGFVNTHCHLELSHLKGKITPKTGFAGFAIELMGKRNAASQEEMQEYMQEADREMSDSGVVLVGDICNTTDTLRRKALSSIRYHSFVELLGLDALKAKNVFEQGRDLCNKFVSEGQAASIVPHAPYSVSVELTQLISDYNEQHNYPSCIHNQESLAEEDFLMGRKSTINGLYDFLQLDISYFKAPGTNSLEHLGTKMKMRPRTFVHNTFSTAEDVTKHADAGTYWCFCPNANLYIENALPRFENFKTAQICIGTDSLASNWQLDVLNEVNQILKNSDVFTVQDLLKALTFSGAAALGMERDYGQLQAGKASGLNLIEIKGKEIRFKKKIG